MENKICRVFSTASKGSIDSSYSYLCDDCFQICFYTYQDPKQREFGALELKYSEWKRN